ncbi:4'-phosphopantetheinyl transferase family protein [Vaginella massiliensis]|uniref:4'-phosphopantetheinyl transferase family protein n=1 Tax=Vaginella massiliensis TaxID=1816680 RepID=UPI0008396DBB|nr:4'-phosphopantetheinyl transferase superfamily protein [Vaginella massiliensis]
MPIIKDLKFRHHTRILCWETSESDEKLLDFLQLSPYRIMKYLTLASKQAKEYLGLRACLKVLDIDLDVLYNENGKPYLPASNELSITHSYGVVAVGVSDLPLGIDLEKSRPNKILNIRTKFIRDDEQDWIAQYKDDEVEYLHIIWGLKECLYKLNGGNLWNFLHHYRIEEFELKEESLISCWISDEKKSRKYYGHYKRIGDFYLTWVLDYA